MDEKRALGGSDSDPLLELGPEVVSFVSEQDDERLDKIIPKYVADVSRAMVQRLIKDGAVTVNRSLSKPSYRVQVGDEIVVNVPLDPPEQVSPEEIALDILFEDEYLLVVSKPAGMVVHPGPGHPGGTLVNALLAHCPGIAEVGGANRAGIVHRLDKETSGLLVVAKDEATRTALQRQFKRRQVSKTYLALVEGQIQPREAVIEVPVGRDKRQRKKMTVARTGREARTTYRAVEYFRNHTLVEVRPITGRTHQIRVHLAWMGCPVVGDPIYGRRRQRLLHTRHFLHAARLRFVHPATGEDVEFESPVPPELRTVIKQLTRA